MAYRLFEGKQHASSYWKYRISPSGHLFQHVLDFLEKHVSVTNASPSRILSTVNGHQTFTAR